MAVILVSGLGVPSEDTEGPSEFSLCFCKSLPNSAPMWEPTGQDVDLKWPALGVTGCKGVCQSSGMAVTISVARAGVASRDGDKDLRESDDIRAGGYCHLWATLLLPMGHLVVQGAAWGLDPAFRCSMPSEHSLEGCIKAPHKLNSLPRELQETQR